MRSQLRDRDAALNAVNDALAVRDGLPSFTAAAACKFASSSGGAPLRVAPHACTGHAGEGGGCCPVSGDQWARGRPASRLGPFVAGEMGGSRSQAYFPLCGDSMLSLLVTLWLQCATQWSPCGSNRSSRTSRISWQMLRPGMRCWRLTMPLPTASWKSPRCVQALSSLLAGCLFPFSTFCASACLCIRANCCGRSEKRAWQASASGCQRSSSGPATWLRTSTTNLPRSTGTHVQRQRRQRRTWQLQPRYVRCT